MSLSLCNLIVKDILRMYYPTIQSMVRQLALVNRDSLTINTDCGEITIKFKQYGTYTKST